MDRGVTGVFRSCGRWIALHHCIHQIAFNVRVASTWFLPASPLNLLLLPFPPDTAAAHKGTFNLNDGSLPRTYLILLHDLPDGAHNLPSLPRDLQHTSSIVGQHTISEL